jgi:hypothetical protein
VPVGAGVVLVGGGVLVDVPLKAKALVDVSAAESAMARA